MRKMFFLILSVVICLSMTAPAYANAEKGDTMISSMKPSGVKAASYSYSKIRVSWDAVEGADGYIVYRASNENGTYRKSYTTDNPKKIWYINTNRKSGQVWWYKVRAYKLADGKKVFSKYSKLVSAYARPGTVKVTEIASTGFIYRYLDLKWQKVPGASGYQVYRKERHEEKFTFIGNFKEPAASIEVPDTTKEYDLKVRAYRMVDGKKVYGKFSKVMSYEFDWSEKDLAAAGESYILEQYPETTFSSVNSSGELKTPYNGTSWLAVWPINFCRYEPWENVKAELIAAINTDSKMQGGLSEDLCFYIKPENDKNWVTLYLLS